MTTIDHRILIPAGPDPVWHFVSDIAQNSRWQVDCREVMFLTSRREGPGLRWRYASPDGHEYVVSVSAWYNGLGYEYYFVDGVPFRENKGRIRLQEIPEGTIVQWTFTYELGGVLGGVRNALGISRQIDHTIAESLKSLWQQMKQSGATSRTHEAKSLMRDAPDVEARKIYQPRHTPPSGQTPTQPQRLVAVPAPLEPPVREGDGQKIAIIDEPPIQEEDTRRRRAAAAATGEVPPSAIPADIEGEPEFLNEIVDLSRFEPPREATDTRPVKPITPAEEAGVPSAPEQPAASMIPIAAEVPPPLEETEPLTVPLPTTLPGYPTPAAEARGAEVYDAPKLTEVANGKQPGQPEPEAVEAAADESPTAPVAEEEPTVPSAAASADATLTVEVVTPAPEEATPPATPPVETATPPSIWEVFGVPRPSETQQVAVAQPEPETSEPAAPAAAPTEAIAAEPAPAAPTPLPEKLVLPSAAKRTGLRILLRQKQVRLRHP